MLVCRPKKEILKYKGYSLVLESQDQTQDLERFEKTQLELQLLLKSLLEI
jgi:hypothetical protein